MRLGHLKRLQTLAQAHTPPAVDRLAQPFDRGDRGSALLLALMSLVLLTGLGVGLVTLSNTESVVAANFRVGSETLYAADAAAERALQDILAASNWNPIVGGAAHSGFLDDTLTPTTPTGAHLDLAAMTTAMQDAWGGAWGANTPAWQLFASGPLGRLVSPSGDGSPAYVIVWVADDAGDADGNPLADSNGVMMLRARAIGAAGSDRVVEVVVSRATGAGGVATGPAHVTAWREVR